MLRYIWVVGLLIFSMAAARSAERTQARLLLSHEMAQPGQRVQAGVLLAMPQGWHTYWRNPGDSGGATRIQWQLPPGIEAGAIQWPPPEKYTDSDLTTYVYHDEVLLLVPLAISSNAPSGEVVIKAKVSWLECEKLCLPGGASVEASLIIGNEIRLSESAPVIATWEARLPQPGTGLAPRAFWGAGLDADTRQVHIEAKLANGKPVADFFPYEAESYEVSTATETIQSNSDKSLLQKTVKKLEPEWPQHLEGLVMGTGGAGQKPLAYEVRLPITEAPAASLPVEAAPAELAAPAGSPASLGLMLAFAFIGGLILNIMPCVLPVIALKVLGFVNQSQQDPKSVRTMGLIYGAGVLCSFLVLAGLVIGVQLAGRQASWGMQFGNPVFLVILTILVTLVALNLFGVFEITLSGSVLGAADELARREGKPGAFFNGVLATALATPCTAPFLGASLGYAFVQPPLLVLVFFLVVGAGLAFPYVLLSWNPRWLRFVPKPGPWMERFKIAMGFPMLATAVWLFHLTPLHYGRRVLWLGLFLVILALAAWVYGEFVQRGRKRRGWAGVIALLLLLGGYAYALEGQLHWRGPFERAGDAQSASLNNHGDGIAWIPWTPEAVAEARQAGRPVLVDFTADWCLTCQANKKTSLEIPSVRQKLKDINAVALLGDYTALPPEMTAELRRFGRAGVPLVLVYPKQADQPPMVLPEVLTPQIVLQALERAGLEK